ncbi:hypothetical protein WDSVgp6 [Walleye dermal sarcoma virus]|uniref:Retroviral cyclin n=1 Tax=Walleye dermal sarcoma virus TaxID=39720 RepID=CYCL_WDSV|nr:hypothetical protein WDSVgp6 [Walleye dermal sarcoma virus]Q88939.1 RecName: Full=Retroviral cyclin; Short=Rv-cyclin; AltName: Full=ORF-A protein [Walleye dermal sarcoma virus]AAA99528.1 ORF-A [Walleye dermal sarcoma virus]AAC82609.1 ORF-A [Walleye dermal sarcoma virus]ABO25844.1 OrfA [Walleye dermal sarcoma virus]
MDIPVEFLTAQEPLSYGHIPPVYWKELLNWIDRILTHNQATPNTWEATHMVLLKLHGTLSFSNPAQLPLVAAACLQIAAKHTEAHSRLADPDYITMLGDGVYTKPSLLLTETMALFIVGGHVGAYTLAACDWLLGSLPFSQAENDLLHPYMYHYIKLSYRHRTPDYHSSPALRAAVVIAAAVKGADLLEMNMLFIMMYHLTHISTASLSLGLTHFTAALQRQINLDFAEAEQREAAERRALLEREREQQLQEARERLDDVMAVLEAEVAITITTATEGTDAEDTSEVDVINVVDPIG